jgi:hypothetical protein
MPVNLGRTCALSETAKPGPSEDIGFQISSGFIALYLSYLCPGAFCGESKSENACIRSRLWKHEGQNGSFIQ